MKAPRPATTWLPLVLLLPVWLTVVSASAADRLPVPNEDSQLKARATVKDVFRADIAAAKTSAAQSELARKLLTHLEDKPDAAAANHALLVQAHALAVKALDAALARQIVDKLAERYDVDGLLLRTSTLRDLAKAPKQPALQIEIAESAMKLVEECLQRERYDAALPAAELAYSVSLKIRNNDLRRQADARRAEVAEFQKLWDASRKAAETLKASPQDPAANDAVGRYLIAARSDWNTGLTHWVLSAVAELRKVAQLDNAAIGATELPNQEAVMQLGDAWWDLAEKQSSSAVKAAMKLRAGQWYGSISETTQGLTKARLEQRVTESGWRDDPELASRMPRSRAWPALQQRVEAATGMLRSNFALCQTLPLDEASDLNAALARWKFRPIRFRPYPTPEGLKVAAIWHPDGVESEVFLDAESEVQSRVAERGKQGFWPVDMAGFVDASGKDQHAVVFAKTKLPGADEFELTLGTPVGTRLPQEQSTRPFTRHIYWNQWGERVQDFLWGKPKGSVYYIRGDEATIKKFLAETKHQVIDIALTMPPKEADVTKAYYCAVSQPRNDVQFVESHAETLEQNLVEWRKLTESGYVPAALGVAVTSNGTPLSISIWHAAVK